MSKMIKRLGHRVKTAEHGKIALDMMFEASGGKDGTARFDIVFLDK